MAGPLSQERTAFRFLVAGTADGPTEELDFGSLARASAAVAEHLRAVGATGERVLLLFPTGIEFVTGFLGCLEAGAIAVPATAPEALRLERTLPRMLAIARDADARFVLASPALRALVAEAPGLEDLTWLALPRGEAGDPGPAPTPVISGDAPATRTSLTTCNRCRLLGSSGPAIISSVGCPSSTTWAW